MTKLRIAVVAVTFALIAGPATGQTPRCSADSPSACSPGLPGVDLPPEAALVRVTDFTLRKGEEHWLADLTLETDNHPGRVDLYAWWWELTTTDTWLADPGASSTETFRNVIVGFADPSTPNLATGHGLSIIWKASGELWHWHASLHTRGRGTFHFSAGQHTMIPWWIRDQVDLP